MRHTLTQITLLVTLGAWASPAHAAVEAHAPQGILDLFESADVVLLGERPWSKLDSDLRNAVVRHPDFAKIVDDVVIEFASALHQDILDTYVLELKPVPAEELRKIWRDTTQPGTWEPPVYREFIDVVRQANVMTPPEKRVRVVAGDPPIEWDKIHGWADTAPYRDRIGHAVEVIGREVIEKKRRALVIYREENLPRGMSGRRGNMTNRLEAAHPGSKILVIATVPDASKAVPELEKSIDISKRPTLVKLSRSSIGLWPAKMIFENAKGSLKQMADGLLYMGNLRDRRIRPPHDAASDTAYVREILRRRSIVGP